MINITKICALFIAAITLSNPIKAMQVGRLEVICGPMYSGKTTELIRRVEQAQQNGKEVLAIKHAFDNRYDKTDIVSHNQKSLPALPICDNKYGLNKILELAKDCNIVAIDEIQFFIVQNTDSILGIIDTLLLNGKRVIVAGLDFDFRQENFAIMPTLKDFADEFIRLQARCNVCNQAAEYSQRLIDGQPAAYNDPVVLIGPDELYEPRCKDCFVIRK